MPQLLDFFLLPGSVAKNRLGDTHQAGGYGIVGCALALDDPACRVAGLEKNLFHRPWVASQPLSFAELRQPHACDIGQRPQRHFAVPVFADDVAMDTASNDAEILAEEVTKA
jgi:hypothetical protein